jgi:hypothetical protein
VSNGELALSVPDQLGSLLLLIDNCIQSSTIVLPKKEEIGQLDTGRQALCPPFTVCFYCATNTTGAFQQISTIRYHIAWCTIVHGITMIIHHNRQRFPVLMPLYLSPCCLKQMSDQHKQHQHHRGVVFRLEPVATIEESVVEANKFAAIRKCKHHSLTSSTHHP